MTPSHHGSRCDAPDPTVGWRDDRSSVAVERVPPPGSANSSWKAGLPKASPTRARSVPRPGGGKGVPRPCGSRRAGAARPGSATRGRRPAASPPRLGSRTRGPRCRLPVGRCPTARARPRPTEPMPPRPRRPAPGDPGRGGGRVATPARGSVRPRGQLDCQEQRGDLPGAREHACQPVVDAQSERVVPADGQASWVPTGDPGDEPGERQCPDHRGGSRRTPVRARLGGTRTPNATTAMRHGSVRPAASRPRARTGPAP